METLYENDLALPIDKGLLCLEQENPSGPYFCYPANAQPIGFEGAIMYCFLPEYGEMVFACNPESCADTYVYPLAKNFQDYIRLVLAYGTANPVEQIVWMDQNRFDEHRAAERKLLTAEQKAAAQQLQHEFGLLPMENPFEYVKAVQRDFDGRNIRYRDEYFDVTGLEDISDIFRQARKCTVEAGERRRNPLHRCFAAFLLSRLPNQKPSVELSPCRVVTALSIQSISR